MNLQGSTFDAPEPEGAWGNSPGRTGVPYHRPRRGSRRAIWSERLAWAAPVLVAALVLVSSTGPLARPMTRIETVLIPSQLPLSHVVVVVMENHPFDNFFGTYCQTFGPSCPNSTNGIPPGTCVPIDPKHPALGCTRPYPFSPSQLVVPDIPHSWISSITAINGGTMNGFYRAEGAGTEPFGYYNGSTIPIYWDLAQQYGLGDNFFSSALAYSLPNHWYLMAGQAPPIGLNMSDLASVASQHAYLDEANRTKTVEDLLNSSPSTSWKDYNWAYTSYNSAINLGPGAIEGSAYSYWDPLAAKAESYTQWYESHHVSRWSFFNDTAAGQLPNISWVIPSFTFSDHAPANLDSGQAFVASVVDAVERSPDWSSTAVFVTWDDYGGFFDHVAPPRLDTLGLSFRVPLLVVSPFTPRGIVVHALGYFESILHFVEWRFGLGCITPRDCGAPLPLGYFQFGDPPRPPMMFPINATSATYPMPLASSTTTASQGVGLAALPCPGACPDGQLWNAPPPPPCTPETRVD